MPIPAGRQAEQQASATRQHPSRGHCHPCLTFPPPSRMQLHPSHPACTQPQPAAPLRCTPPSSAQPARCRHQGGQGSGAHAQQQRRVLVSGTGRPGPAHRRVLQGRRPLRQVALCGVHPRRPLPHGPAGLRLRPGPLRSHLTGRSLLLGRLVSMARDGMHAAGGLEDKLQWQKAWVQQGWGAAGLRHIVQGGRKTQCGGGKGQGAEAWGAAGLRHRVQQGAQGHRQQEALLLWHGRWCWGSRAVQGWPASLRPCNHVQQRNADVMHG